MHVVKTNVVIIRFEICRQLRDLGKHCVFCEIGRLQPPRDNSHPIPGNILVQWLQSEEALFIHLVGSRAQEYVFSRL